jgi:formate hydrogenlyase subunit 6/NADH:ubiquinone oxidoreductase subunit I
MLGAKLRQIAFGLGHPRVTVGYPLAPLAPDPGYRGHVTVDTERCVGCGGCAEVCPSRCVLMTDLDESTRVIRRHLDRCLLCGRCEEACAYDAVHLVADWETGTPDRGDLLIEQRLFMGVCDRCGRCYVPIHQLDRVKGVGFRADEPELLAAEAARRAQRVDARAAAGTPGGPPGEEPARAGAPAGSGTRTREA